ncbi:MAG TPA: hypothetical protein VJC15_02660, partial [Candidatus Paceibacterota bacterium]
EAKEEVEESIQQPPVYHEEEPVETQPAEPLESEQVLEPERPEEEVAAEPEPVSEPIPEAVAPEEPLQTEVEAEPQPQAEPDSEPTKEPEEKLDLPDSEVRTMKGDLEKEKQKKKSE